MKAMLHPPVVFKSKPFAAATRSSEVMSAGGDAQSPKRNLRRISIDMDCLTATRLFADWRKLSISSAS